LSAHGRAADQREQALLAPFPGSVRADVLDGSWSPPVSDGSGRDRALLKQALALFSAAGYELRGAELTDTRTRQPFSFEIMVANKDEERLAMLFTRTLKQAGISPRIRLVDAVQFEGRRLAFDFDMIQNRWDQSLSPGNEQAFYWGSAAAAQNGSRNYMGVKNPAVDAMIAALLKAQDRANFVAAVRALDRVLISGSYVVPLFHLPDQWVAGLSAAYARFDGYVPRQEPPSFLAGGKAANVQRVEWVVQPDSATAAAALQKGEVDWLEVPLIDLCPMLRHAPGVQVAVNDPFAIFLAKLCANTIFLLVAELVLLFVFAVFYNVSVFPVFPQLVLVFFLGSLGISTTGTALSAVSSQARMREVLLPLLLMPLLVPVLIPSTEATKALLETEPALRWDWLGILVAFDAVFLTALWLFGEYLLEE